MLHLIQTGWTRESIKTDSFPLSAILHIIIINWTPSLIILVINRTHSLFIIYLFIYLNIFIQDIKHNSARLLYVVSCTIKLCGCIKILFLIQSFQTIMGGSIFKVRWQTDP